MNDPGVLSAIGGLSPSLEIAAAKLPPYPAAARKILQLTAKSAGPRELSKALSSDPALTAKALRFANSPLFGHSQAVSSPLEAAAILGAETLNAIASAHAFSGIAPALRSVGFDSDAFLAHSLRAACCSKRLARILHFDPELAFSAGLLHDIGGAVIAIADSLARPASAASAPAASPCGCCSCAPPPIEPTSSDAAAHEQEHARVAAALSLLWDFPSDIAFALLTHHDFDRATPLGKIVACACSCSAAANSDADLLLFSQAWEPFFLLPPGSLATLAAESLSDFDEILDSIAP